MLRSNIYLIVIAIYIIVLAPDVIKLIKLAKTPSLDFKLERYIFRTHIFVFICGISLITVLVAFEVNVFNYSLPIEYSERDKISLNDFNGLKLPKQKLQGSNQFAFITSNIEMKSFENVVYIKSYFHPARSYVYVDNLQDGALLTHELYHFDITELWARHLRAQISNFSEYPSKRRLSQLYEKIVTKKDSMQNAYDFETNHGYLLGKQLQWQSYIDSTLTGLDSYIETSIRF